MGEQKEQEEGETRGTLRIKSRSHWNLTLGYCVCTIDSAASPPLPGTPAVTCSFYFYGFSPKRRRPISLFLPPLLLFFFLASVPQEGQPRPALTKNRFKKK